MKIMAKIFLISIFHLLDLHVYELMMKWMKTCLNVWSIDVIMTEIISCKDMTMIMLMMMKSKKAPRRHFCLHKIEDFLSVFSL